MTLNRENESVHLNCSDTVRRMTYESLMWFSIHNHALSDKLASHPIVSYLITEERKLLSDMTLNILVSKKILAYLTMTVVFELFWVCSVKERRNTNLSAITLYKR